MKNNRELDVLIELMAKLPGLGPRSARRAVLHLIRKRNSLLLPLADMLSNLSETAQECLSSQTLIGKSFSDPPEIPDKKYG